MKRTGSLSTYMTTSPLYLITGAAGFIGARFIESCNQKKISVISVDQADLFQNRPEHLGIHYGQIIDREELFSWLQKESPKLNGIIHLGAISDTRETNLSLLSKF